MPKSEVVIFGRSPFIGQVDIPNIAENYTTIGLNYFGHHFHIDYLFFNDVWCGWNCQPKQVLVPSTFDDKYPGQRYKLISATSPVANRVKDADGHLKLAIQGFTVSLALDFAISQGFTKIYLVGIDHVESDELFEHYDDIPIGYCELTPLAHKQLKQYVYNCQQHADIFQCNPAVADQWDLPFKDVNELYGPQVESN